MAVLSMSMDPPDLLEPLDLREDRESVDPRDVPELLFLDPRERAETRDAKEDLDAREPPADLVLLEAVDPTETVSTAPLLVLLLAIKHRERLDNLFGKVQ